MPKCLKLLYSRCKKGFTFMVVPNNSGQIRSIAIPFYAIVLILVVIIFNLYIFIGYTTQIWKLDSIKKQIFVKNRQIELLKREQGHVKPTLDKARKTLEELNQLKKEREQLLATWRNIQQKSGRGGVPVSRGVFVRSYRFNSQATDNPSETTLQKLETSMYDLDRYIKEESQEQARLLKSLQDYDSKLDHTPTIWPVQSMVTSLFGRRFHPKLQYYRAHTGVDLKAHYGSKVRAAAAGTVNYAGWRSGYGYTVVISHGYGYETLYAHNSKLIIRAGAKVKKGQVISLSGNSGTSTGPHLHYEVHVNNEPVNPIMFLKN